MAEPATVPAATVPAEATQLQATLARDWALQVIDPKTSKYVFVLGLSKFASKRSATMKDDSDINSGGYKSQIATAMQQTFEGEGMRKGTKAAGAEFVQDRGQEILRTVGGKMGLDNVIKARCWRTDGVQEGYESLFSVDWTDKDGGNEDLDSFSFTLMSRGKPTEIMPVTDAAGVSVPKPA